MKLVAAFFPKAASFSPAGLFEHVDHQSVQQAAPPAKACQIYMHPRFSYCVKSALSP
jgi:hypothetical protein